MKRTISLTAAILLIGGMLVGCACKIPSWYKKVPQDANFTIMSGEGESKQMNLARDKATERAMANMGLSIESMLDAYRSDFQEEVGPAIESRYYEMMKQMSSRATRFAVQGAVLEESDFCEIKGGWRAYVLYSMPVGAALLAFENEISEEQELYTRFIESEVGKEMADKIVEYNEWKETRDR